MSLFRPQWFAYNPTRMQNFSQLQGFLDASGWMNEAVIQHQYGCITPAGGGSCFTVDDPQYHNRDGWSLYAGAGGISYTGPEGGIGFVPAATDGMSLGYTPWSGEVGGDADWKTNVQTTPRTFNWNL